MCHAEKTNKWCFLRRRTLLHTDWGKGISQLFHWGKTNFVTPLRATHFPVTALAILEAIHLNGRIGLEFAVHLLTTCDRKKLTFLNSQVPNVLFSGQINCPLTIEARMKKSMVYRIVVQLAKLADVGR